VELVLNSEEKKLLIDVLEERHREFLREISRSHHHHELKTGLRFNEKLLESVLNKLRAGELAHSA
jgi:hypothetical protein